MLFLLLRIHFEHICEKIIYSVQIYQRYRVFVQVLTLYPYWFLMIPIVLTVLGSLRLPPPLPPLAEDTYTINDIIGIKKVVHLTNTDTFNDLDIYFTCLDKNTWETKVVLSHHYTIKYTVPVAKLHAWLNFGYRVQDR